VGVRGWKGECGQETLTFPRFDVFFEDGCHEVDRVEV
jgi:hypothetical protein